MSSLIFFTDENQALVATDTLATTPDGEPFKFLTKVFIVPHLKLMIAGTGAGGFSGRWLVQINEGMVVKGIENLNAHAPRVLAGLWPDYKAQTSLPENITATIYHFGFSEVTGQLRSFAYRSTNNFRSEILGYGLGTKPECTVPEGWSLPRDLKKMMDDQRIVQASLPKEQRVYIGGEIEIYHLTKDGFSVYTLERFEDYANDEVGIFKNFETSKLQ